MVLKGCVHECRERVMEGGSGYILSMRLRRRDHDVIVKGFMINTYKKKYKIFYKRKSRAGPMKFPPDDNCKVVMIVDMGYFVSFIFVYLPKTATYPR